jgi:type II secretory pathway pseudopilin PulG/allophanate hydrolase subunit 1
MITNQGQEQLIRNFDSPLQKNFERTGSPANIPPELLNDPNFIRQQQMLQQQQQFMQQQQLMQQQQQYMNSPHGFNNGMGPGFNAGQFNGVDLDLSSDEELLDDVVPRRKPTETEALAEFLRRTGPEEPPANSQKKKKNSIFSFKKQNKKDKSKNNNDMANRPKHIPLMGENENNGNGIYSPSPNNMNNGPGNGPSPNGMSMNGQMNMNMNINPLSPEENRMMMPSPPSQHQHIPGQNQNRRKKTDSQILEESLKTSNQMKQYMRQIQQITEQENQKKMSMMGYPSDFHQNQRKSLIQTQSAFLQQQQLEDDDIDYPQAPVPIQPAPFMPPPPQPMSDMNGMSNANNNNVNTSGNANVSGNGNDNGNGEERKRNSRHPPRTSSMVISHFLINQQGMEPYEVQQRMDELAFGITENGEIISDHGEEEEEEIEGDEDFFSDDDDDYFSEEDSEVIRNTRINAEMRPEDYSFINEPIPKARTNKTVQFCEEVGEISDSDYYYEDSDYENEAYIDDNEEDEDEEQINPQPQPQMQNMEDMPNTNAPQPMPQQGAQGSLPPSKQGPQGQGQNKTTVTGKNGQKHIIHKSKLKDEDSKNETQTTYNMVSLPPPEMSTIEITYTSEEAELEEAAKELQQLEEEEQQKKQQKSQQMPPPPPHDRGDRRRSNVPPQARNGPPRNSGRGGRGKRDPSQRPISMSVNMKNLPSYHKHHPQDGQPPKPYPQNQPRPRRRHVQIQTRKPHLHHTGIQTDPEATKEYEALVEELNAASTEKNATIESLQEEVNKYRISSQKLSDELKSAQESYQKTAEERDALLEKNKELMKMSDDKQVQFDNLSAQAYTKIQDLVLSQQKLLRERHAMENEIMKLREELKRAKAFINQNYSNGNGNGNANVNNANVNPSSMGMGSPAVMATQASAVTMGSPATKPINLSQKKSSVASVSSSANSTPVLMEGGNDASLMKKQQQQQQQMQLQMQMQMQQMKMLQQQQQQQQMKMNSPSLTAQSMTPPLSATSSPGIYAQKIKNNGNPIAHHNMMGPKRVASPTPKPVQIVQGVQGVQGVDVEIANANIEVQPSV